MFYNWSDTSLHLPLAVALHLNVYLSLSLSFFLSVFFASNFLLNFDTINAQDIGMNGTDDSRTNFQTRHQSVVDCFECFVNEDEDENEDEAANKRQRNIDIFPETMNGDFI